MNNTYIASAGEYWDEIALKNYGDEDRVPWLLEANPNHTGTLRFQGGEEIIIPPYDASQAGSLPPWKRGG